MHGVRRGPGQKAPTQRISGAADGAEGGQGAGKGGTCGKVGACDRAVASPTFSKRLVFTLVCIPAVLPTTFFSALTCHGGGRGARGGGHRKHQQLSPPEGAFCLPHLLATGPAQLLDSPDSPPGSGPAAPASASLAPPAGPHCLCHRHRPPSPTARSPQTYFGRRSQSPGEQFRTGPPPHRRAGPECKLEGKREGSQFHSRISPWPHP